MFTSVSNITSTTQTTTWPEDKSSRGWLTLCIMLLALFGHTLVFFAFYRERNLRTLQNIIIVNLSAADFLFSAIVPLTHIVRLLRREATLSETSCYVTGVASMLFCLASINTLTFISVERFMATNYPIKHRRYFDLKLVKVVLIIIWCWSVILSVFPFLTTRYVFLKRFFHCSPDWGNNLGTTLTLAVVGIGLPMTILIYCNSHIVRALRKSRQIHTSLGTVNSRHQRDRQMSILTVTVVVTFAICCAPYCAAMLCLARGECGFSQNFMLLALMLSTLNSCCNPLIYGLLNKNFRNAFKNILACQWDRSLPGNPGNMLTISAT